MDKTTAAPLRVGQTHPPGMGLGSHQESAPKSRYRLIRFVLVAAALGWLGGEIYIRWAELTSLSLDGRWFSISIVAFAVALLTQVVAWRWNLVCLGADISYPSLFRLYYTMNLARYIPGKIWSLAGMVAGCLMRRACSSAWRIAFRMIA